MIIIPELETVVIMVPRTGTTSLKKAIHKRYPRAISLYRHMEADGVPHGYDRWPKVGVIRKPIERLWSLYKYLSVFPEKPQYSKAWINRMRGSVKSTFSEWLLENQVVFTNPYSFDGGRDYYPEYNVLHSIPENMKSQYHYLRPDLGTEIYLYEYDLPRLFSRLGVDPGHLNGTDFSHPPEITPKAQTHIHRVFEWDLEQYHIGVES